jgi:tol-pal system protein YbgF
MYFLRTLPVAAVAMTFFLVGCGESEETTGQEEWEATPTVSPTARLEYRIDSLMNENRRLSEQVDATMAENRRLTARNAELETKATETPATTPGETAVPPTPASTAPAPGVSSTGMGGGYESALAQYHQRNYSDAITQFEGLLNSGVSDQVAGNCHYWIGESYYGMRKYDEAIQHFETVLDTKTSGKKADAQFMIGNAQLAKKNAAGAKEAFEKVVSNFPTSGLVDKAKARLAKLK